MTVMRKALLLRRIAAAIIVTTGVAAMSAQVAAQGTTAPGASIEDSIATLQNTIVRRTADRDQLRRMLASLNVIDSVYRPLYPAWLVLDDDLKERINRAFRERHPDVSRDTDVVVIANPGRGQILGLSVGSVKLGRLETPQTISDSLNRELLQGDYQRKDVNLRSEPPRTNVLNTEPQYASLAASAFA